MDFSPEEDERRLLFEERFKSGTRGEETDDLRRWGKEDWGCCGEAG